MKADDADSIDDRPGALAGAILDLEQQRHSDVDAAVEPAIETLQGVGEKPSLADAFRSGGKLTFFTLAGLSLLDNLETATLGTLAPEIRDTLGVSDGAIVFISAASGAFLMLGAMPMGWMADRFRRSRIIAFATLIFAAMVALSGLAVNALMLFFARLGVGIAKSNEFAVHGPLLADQYPIGTRGRVGSTLSLASRGAATLSPLLVGGLAAALGGGDSWRWVFVILALPVVVASFFAFRLPEPPRGQNEKLAVIGEVIEDEDPLPISLEAAFSRLRQIRTLRSVILAFAALGFGLFTVPILGNLFLEDEYQLGTFGRGLASSVSGIFVLIAIPFAGRLYDRMYTEDPAKALRLVGYLVLPSALLTPLQFFMPNAVLFTIFGIPGAVLMSCAFVMVGPIMSSIVPYRLRGIGTAYGSLYIFLIGATGGAVLAAAFTNASGPRTAVLLIAVPSTMIGGIMIIRGASFIRNDLALVASELHEEFDEHQRRSADLGSLPALQVQHIDFAYGEVQILFDVSFEVRQGEVLALLGTNGAGKSTILRVIAGLGTPARGVVRFAGRGITYVSPEMRTRLGIRMLPGGKGVFPDLTVHENIEIAAFNHRADRADMRTRMDEALALFPELIERRDQLASTLSGGQQQLLALARVLTDRPSVLIIDELSLGLAPVMVERMVGIVRDLKAKGITIIVVEQSLNVASAFADRAVFLEKGHVRFEGQMSTLVERDDLARAVFLGSEGG